MSLNDRGRLRHRGARLVASIPKRIDAFVLRERFSEFRRLSGDDVDDAGRDIGSIEHLIKVRRAKRVSRRRRDHDTIAHRNRRHHQRDKRQQAKTNFRNKIEAMRSRLLGALTTQFTGEADNMVERMHTGVQPYTRFVRAEHDRLDSTLNTLAGLRQRLSALKARAEQVSRGDSLDTRAQVQQLP